MYSDEELRLNPFEAEMVKFMKNIDAKLGEMSEAMNALLPEPMTPKALISKLTAYFKVDLEEYIKQTKALSKRMDRREKDVQAQLDKIHNNQNKNYLLIRGLMDK